MKRLCMVLLGINFFNSNYLVCSDQSAIKKSSSQSQFITSNNSELDDDFVHVRVGSSPTTPKPSAQTTTAQTTPQQNSDTASSPTPTIIISGNTNATSSVQTPKHLFSSTPHTPQNIQTPTPKKVTPSPQPSLSISVDTNPTPSPNFEHLIPGGSYSEAQSPKHIALSAVNNNDGSITLPEINYPDGSHFAGGTVNKKTLDALAAMTAMPATSAMPVTQPSMLRRSKSGTKLDSSSHVSAPPSDNSEEKKKDKEESCFSQCMQCKCCGCFGPVLQYPKPSSSCVVQ